jgi:hypothetical protein
MRTIIARFEIEDNDLMEQKLFDSLQCESLKDFTKLPDTNELYQNDETFRKLVKAVKTAKDKKDEYYNKQRLKL